jgi:dihydroneopterin aldolase
VAAETDQIGGAVDYEAVARDVTELAGQRRFRLIETMAEEAAALLLARHAPVTVVRIEIRKPDAVAAAECSFVRVERSR